MQPIRVGGPRCRSNHGSADVLPQSGIARDRDRLARAAFNCPFSALSWPGAGPGALRHHHTALLYPHWSSLLTRLVGAASRGENLCERKTCANQLKPTAGTAYSSQSEGQATTVAASFPSPSSPTAPCQARPLYARTENILSETSLVLHPSQGP